MRLKAGKVPATRYEITAFMSLRPWVVTDVEAFIAQYHEASGNTEWISLFKRDDLGHWKQFFEIRHHLWRCKDQGFNVRILRYQLPDDFNVDQCISITREDGKENVTRCGQGRCIGWGRRRIFGPDFIKLVDQ